jgi:hypothetical protein
MPMIVLDRDAFAVAILSEVRYPPRGSNIYILDYRR